MVVIGNAASGEDISREIADVAKEVHISGRTWSASVDFSEPIGQHGNIWRHSTVMDPFVFQPLTLTIEQLMQIEDEQFVAVKL